MFQPIIDNSSALAAFCGGALSTGLGWLAPIGAIGGVLAGIAALRALGTSAWR